VIFLATGSHFQSLAGVNDFLFRHSRESDHFREQIPDRESLACQDNPALVPRQYCLACKAGEPASMCLTELGPKIDFRLFVGLDLSSESDQIASFSHGTFDNASWRTDNYLNNLLAPYADKFDGYMAKVYPGEEGRHIDAIAPPKRTWKNYMPVPLGFDSEAVTFVGKEGITLATPSTIRRIVDTPVDRAEFVNFENLTRQIRTTVGALLKAGEDPEFFRVSKLKLQDRGHSLEGRILWFDRNVDFALPRVPVPGAVVVYQQPGPTGSATGVRTLVLDKTSEGPIYDIAQANDAANIDPVLFGPRKHVDLTGRFNFDIMRNRFSNQILAYEIDDGGRIVSAPDLGSEGDKKFPTTQRYGWW
jgi:hypothetical protein